MRYKDGGRAVGEATALALPWALSNTKRLQGKEKAVAAVPMPIQPPPPVQDTGIRAMGSNDSILTAETLRLRTRGSRESISDGSEDDSECCEDHTLDDEDVLNLCQWLRSGWKGP